MSHEKRRSLLFPFSFSSSDSKSSGSSSTGPKFEVMNRKKLGVNQTPPATRSGPTSSSLSAPKLFTAPNKPVPSSGSSTVQPTSSTTPEPTSTAHLLQHHVHLPHILSTASPPRSSVSQPQHSNLTKHSNSTTSFKHTSNAPLSVSVADIPPVPEFHFANPTSVQGRPVSMTRGNGGGTMPSRKSPPKSPIKERTPVLERKNSETSFLDTPTTISRAGDQWDQRSLSSSRYDDNMNTPTSARTTAPLPNRLQNGPSLAPVRSTTPTPSLGSPRVALTSAISNTSKASLGTSVAGNVGVDNISLNRPALNNDSRHVSYISSGNDSEFFDAKGEEPDVNEDGTEEDIKQSKALNKDQLSLISSVLGTDTTTNSSSASVALVPATTSNDNSQIFSFPAKAPNNSSGPSLSRAPSTSTQPLSFHKKTRSSVSAMSSLLSPINTNFDDSTSSPSVHIKKPSISDELMRDIDDFHFGLQQENSPAQPESNHNRVNHEILQDINEFETYQTQAQSIKPSESVNTFVNHLNDDYAGDVSPVTPLVPPSREHSPDMEQFKYPRYTNKDEAEDKEDDDELDTTVGEVDGKSGIRRDQAAMTDLAGLISSKDPLTVPGRDRFAEDEFEDHVSPISPLYGASSQTQSFFPEHTGLNEIREYQQPQQQPQEDYEEGYTFRRAVSDESDSESEDGHQHEELAQRIQEREHVAFMKDTPSPEFELEEDRSVEYEAGFHDTQDESLSEFHNRDNNNSINDGPLSRPPMNNQFSFQSSVHGDSTFYADSATNRSGKLENIANSREGLLDDEIDIQHDPIKRVSSLYDQHDEDSFMFDSQNQQHLEHEDEVCPSSANDVGYDFRQDYAPEKEKEREMTRGTGLRIVNDGNYSSSDEDDEQSIQESEGRGEVIDQTPDDEHGPILGLPEDEDEEQEQILSFIAKSPRNSNSEFQNDINSPVSPVNRGILPSPRGELSGDSLIFSSPGNPHLNSSGSLPVAESLHSIPPPQAPIYDRRNEQTVEPVRHLASYHGVQRRPPPSSSNGGYTVNATRTARSTSITQPPINNYNSAPSPVLSIPGIVAQARVASPLTSNVSDQIDVQQQLQLAPSQQQSVGQSPDKASSNDVTVQVIQHVPQKSKYVENLRLSAKTANTSVSSAVWGLPIGISNSDDLRKLSTTVSRSSYTGAYSGKKNPIRMNNKIDLKHGKIKPRLLASEFDDDDTDSFQGLSKTSTLELDRYKTGSSSIHSSSTRRGNDLFHEPTIAEGENDSVIPSADINRTGTVKRTIRNGSVVGSGGIVGGRTFLYIANPDIEESD